MSSAKPRKHTAQPSSTYDPAADNIPDDEKWRIIEQSGILKRVPQLAKTPKPPSTASSSYTSKKAKDKDSDDDEVPQNLELLDEEEQDDDFSWEEYVFQALFFSIPFSVLFGTFVVLVNMQYRQDYMWSEIIAKSARMFPVLLTIIYPTNRFKTSQIMQLLMTLASILCGAYLLYITSKASMYGTMLQAPGLATLWVYFVVQVDLTWALGGLAIVAVYYFWGLDK